MKVIILLGAPGSGKGSTAEKLQELTGFAHVSTGDLLRDAIEKGTQTGTDVKPYITSGELVPEDLMVRVVEERLDMCSEDETCMLDGFPRTVSQAKLLEASIDRRGGVITYVFLLETPRDMLIWRLTGRRICRQCGTNYHLVNRAPKKRADLCDLCGGEVYQRPDDSEPTIVTRLEVFNRETEGLIARYEQLGLLLRVDSNKTAACLAAEMKVIISQGDDCCKERIRLGADAGKLPRSR